MRILMLGTTFPRYKGSRVGSFVFALAEALVKKGCHVNVLTTNIPNGKKREIMNGIDVRRFNYFFSPRWQKLTYPGSLLDQVGSSFLAVLQIPVFLLVYIIRTAVMLRENDVVICNWIYTGTIMQIAKRIGFSECPHIIIIHGSDMKFLKKGGFTGRIFLKTLKKADAVCAVAKHFIPVLEKYAITNRYLMPNGIDYDKFSVDRVEAEKSAGLQGRPMVLYVGRLTEAKGIDVLIQAMSGIEDAVLVIIGEGGTGSKLQQLASELGVNVRFLGEVAPDEIPYWMAAATVFVLPSFSEGRPTVINEAMAAGTVCIASDIPGTRELIIHGRTGLLVKAGDVAGFKRSIRLLLNDAHLRKTMARCAYEHLRKMVPSWGEAAEKYISLIKTIRGQNSVH